MKHGKQKYGQLSTRKSAQCDNNEMVILDGKQMTYTHLQELELAKLLGTTLKNGSIAQMMRDGHVLWDGKQRQINELFIRDCLLGGDSEEYAKFKALQELEGLDRQQYRSVINEIERVVISAVTNENNKAQYKDAVITFHSEGYQYYSATKESEQDLIADNAEYLALGIAAWYFHLVD